MPSQIRTQQNDSVDALCWRHYGRTPGAVEAVLKANPGLAQRGVILAQGILVAMPDLPPTQVQPTVQLWD